MPVRIASLNSGSNGNCFYIAKDQTAVLIDAGLSCKETERRMNRLGFDMGEVKALFITHEHNDHITGTVALSRKYHLPVYLTRGTKNNLSVPIDSINHQLIDSTDKITIGPLTVIAFPKHHDAGEPVSFVVTDHNTHIGIMTDIGHCCDQVKHFFRQCHAVFLESNYCDSMLEEGTYTEALKKRIRGKKGHLSNDQALELFLSCRSPELSHLILAHLSQNNNTHKKVQELFLPHAGKILIDIASRHRETAVYEIGTEGGFARSVLRDMNQAGSKQLKLFS